MTVHSSCISPSISGGRLGVKTAFVATKPLQLMVVMCILKQYTFDVHPTIYITDTFFGARTTANRFLKYFDKTLNVEFSGTKKEALDKIKNDKFQRLFIDSDVGVKNFISLAALKISNSNLSINVYEEGFGTYTKDMYVGFKKIALRLNGIGTFFGGCIFTSKVFVFEPIEYSHKFPKAAHKVTPVMTSLWEFIRLNYSVLEYIFSLKIPKKSSPKAKVCRIYLTSWLVDYDFIGYFKKLSGDLYVKPHPHIQDRLFDIDVRIIGRSVPIEVVLYGLLKDYEQIAIYHHGSVAARYVQTAEVNFIKIDSLQDIR